MTSPATTVPKALPAASVDELAALRTAVETLYAHVQALEARTPPPPER